jgi:hypothetical protein
MIDGLYVRIVVAPCVRVMNSTLSTGAATQTRYTKFYLPILAAGSQLGNSQSVTLTGTNVIRDTKGANSVVLRVSFPNQTLGFGSDFFKFSSLTEATGVFSGSIVEFFTGEVTVSLGLYG